MRKMTRDLSKVFKIADGMNAIAFSELLTTDVKFRFSNGSSTSFSIGNCHNYPYSA